MKKNLIIYTQNAYSVFYTSNPVDIRNHIDQLKTPSNGFHNEIHKIQDIFKIAYAWTKPVRDSTQ